MEMHEATVLLSKVQRLQVLRRPWNNWAARQLVSEMEFDKAKFDAEEFKEDRNGIQKSSAPTGKI